ncbi:MAG: type II toxin-antitoxin system RelE/ParE family toxin [Deltaproteobacteria bacterium]|nr:type II toxin-antitoxin system RelE/ParE family toxin [Deltaproteobacteria bacterium]
MKVQYASQAVKDLQGFNAVDRTLIAKKIHYLADNFEQLKQSKKVRELKGTRFPGQYRFTIARKIRAIFRIENNALIMLILRVGRRTDIYT